VHKQFNGLAFKMSDDMYSKKLYKVDYSACTINLLLARHSTLVQYLRARLRAGLKIGSTLMGSSLECKYEIRV